MSPSAQRRELALQLRRNAYRIDRTDCDVLQVIELRRNNLSATLRAFAQYLEDIDVRERAAA